MIWLQIKTCEYKHWKYYSFFSKIFNKFEEAFSIERSSFFLFKEWQNFKFNKSWTEWLSKYFRPGGLLIWRPMGLVTDSSNTELSFLFHYDLNFCLRFTRNFYWKWQTDMDIHPCSEMREWWYLVKIPITDRCIILARCRLSEVKLNPLSKCSFYTRSLLQIYKVTLCASN